MNSRRLSNLVATLGLAAFCSLCLSASAQEPAAQPEGVEVLARGPVHEAYAQPITTQPEPSPVITKQPPDLIEELPPDQKPEGDNVQWMPGYWAWDDEQSDFLWVSGFSRVPPPGRHWMPGHWQEVEGGWMWVAGFWAPADMEKANYLPPPPPSVDQGPPTPAPDENDIYVPGCWVYQETRYLWRPGHWVAYRPNWVWISAHYVWTPSGCLFVDGYWDHPLDECGLLFAPVRFGPQWWVGPRRRFTPQFVVNADFLIGALFVGPAVQHYYFGDYFEQGYRNRGFVPWPDYRLGRGGYDPIFSYYRHLHAAEPHWETSMHDLYGARRNGEVPRPPRTLVQQVQAVKNITANRTAETAVHKNINLTHAQNVTALVPLKQVHNSQVTHLGSLSQAKVSKVPSRELKLEPVPKEEHARAQQATAQIHDAVQQRHQAQAQILSQGGVPVKHTDPPKTVRLAPAKPPAPVASPRPAPAAPPPRPAIPKHEERPIPKYEPPKPPAPPRKK